jgi:REP element-mobilizing transposase RayT
MTTMAADSEPLAYFITWTVYGTFLQGDSRGWRKRGKGHQPPQPRLEQWHADRLRHPIILLSREHRSVVQEEVQRHCTHRGWTLWRVNPRTNHVHMVVTASTHSGSAVRDQLKANCTRGLRERFREYQERPVWSVGGDWESINSESDLERAIFYAGEGQERKERE